MDTFVVVPAYNEENYIGRVLDQLREQEVEVVVVDDGSRDKTATIAKNKGVKVLRNVINLGKGAALRLGCDYACKKGAKKIIVIDADGQHDPAKIPDFVAALHNVDIVFGYRAEWQRMPFVLRFGNWGINTMISILYGVRLRDTQSGYRAFRADVYWKLRWKACDYSMESEMIANMGRRKLRYAQIPIATIYADKYKGTTVLDGVKIVMRMIWWRLQ